MNPRASRYLPCASTFDHDCTACRRCHFEWPLGVDHALITHLARYILSEIGIAPRALVVSTREQLIGKSGNTSGIPVPALLDSLEFMSEEMKEQRGIDIPFPIDQEGAEYLFLPAVSDFMMEADTLMGNAAVFRATGDSWTIGTGYYDGINYGLFYSDHVLERVLQKIRAEAERLKIKKIVIGECGHASRTAKYFYPAFCGGRSAIPVAKHSKSFSLIDCISVGVDRMLRYSQVNGCRGQVTQQKRLNTPRHSTEQTPTNLLHRGINTEGVSPGVGRTSFDPVHRTATDQSDHGSPTARADPSGVGRTEWAVHLASSSSCSALVKAAWRSKLSLVPPEVR